MEAGFRVVILPRESVTHRASVSYTHLQFFRPGTKLNLPVYLDAPVQARLAALAEARGVEFSIFINELLKKDLELIDTTR